MLKPYVGKVINRQNLSAQEAEDAMKIIMTGQATPAQIGGYLVALRMKGETVDEITGSAPEPAVMVSIRLIYRLLPLSSLQEPGTR
jgi:anthranilate phosphoribosyltransferase